jgi:hypothetical protein
LHDKVETEDDRDSDNDYLPLGYNNSYSDNTNPNNDTPNDPNANPWEVMIPTPQIFVRRYFAIFVAFVVFYRLFVLKG